MRVSRLLGIVGCALVVGCGPPTLTTQRRNVERNAIQDQLTTWARVLNNRAIDSVLAMYEESPGVTVVWPDGMRAVGSEQNAQVLNTLYALIQFMNFNPQNPEIDILTPNIAVVNFRHSVDVVYNDTRRDPYSGHGSMVWTKDFEDGQWRIYTQLVSRTPPIMAR